MADAVFGQDDARGILAVNPYAEGSEEWHAWGLGYDHAESGAEDMPTVATVTDDVAALIFGTGATRNEFDYAQWDAIRDAFEDGYRTYVAGWRV